MKKIITILTVLLLLLAVSCNMDSSSGLFEDAGKSVKKESYTIKSVLSKIDTTNYIVASNEGIFLLSDGSKASSAVGTGNIASYSILATGTKESWKAYYYSEKDTKYYSIDNNGKTEEFTGIDSGTYTFNSVYYENVNNDKYVVVFRNGTGKNAIFSGSSSDLLSNSPKITDTDYTNVSYIGDGYFIGTRYNDSDKTSKVYLFSYDGTTVTECCVNNSNYRSHIGGYFVTSGNVIYHHYNTEFGSDSLIKTIGSGNTYKMAKMFEKDGTYYFILNGLKDVYYVKDSTCESKTCTSLTNIEIIAIVDVVDGEYINVITAESGTKCINLKDNSIDSTWK